MRKALKNNKIYNLFLHNIRASKYDDIIFTFKGPSSQNLPLLKNKSFDIIFIDGDHSYDGVYSDIKNSVPLLKDGGIDVAMIWNCNIHILIKKILKS